MDIIVSSGCVQNFCDFPVYFFGADFQDSFGGPGRFPRLAGLCTHPVYKNVCNAKLLCLPGGAPWPSGGVD